MHSPRTLSVAANGIIIDHDIYPWGSPSMPEALYELAGTLPMRSIKINGAPYLERYALEIGDGTYTYLHRFIRGDGDRYLHSHPWALATSDILCGGYEERRCFKHDRNVQALSYRAGQSNVITGSHLHQIIRTQPETWTLFRHGEWETKWGFIDESGAYVENNEVGTGRNRGWWLRSPRGNQHPDRVQMEAA